MHINWDSPNKANDAAVSLQLQQHTPVTISSHDMTHMQQKHPAFSPPGPLLQLGPFCRTWFLHPIRAVSLLNLHFSGDGSFSLFTSMICVACHVCCMCLKIKLNCMLSPCESTGILWGCKPRSVDIHHLHFTRPVCCMSLNIEPNCMLSPCAGQGCHGSG